MAFYSLPRLDSLPEQLKPVRDYLLIKPDRLPDRRPSGLFYPENRLKYPRTGAVMRCGPLVSFDLGPGDRVAFFRAGCQPFRLLDGAEYLFLRERNVLFRIDE